MFLKSTALTAALMVMPIQSWGAFEKPETICQVASNYGEQAGSMKVNDKSMDVDSAISMVFYVLSKSDEFKKLDLNAKEAFLDLVDITYRYVYSDPDITEENSRVKSYNHCSIKLTDTAIIFAEAFEYCQNKGSLYETVALIKAKGVNEEQTRQLFRDAARESDGKTSTSELANDRIQEIVSQVFSSNESFINQGKRIYDECIVKVKNGLSVTPEEGKVTLEK